MSLPKVEQTRFSQLLLVRHVILSHNQVGGPILDLLQYIIVSRTAEPKTAHSTPDVVSQTASRGKESLSLTFALLLAQPKIRLALFVAGAHC